jgi:opacity protein-like surface antigen
MSGKCKDHEKKVRVITNSIRITKLAAMVLALGIIITSASLARAQAVGGAANNPISKSQAEKPGEARSSDGAATPAETKQVHAAETADIGGLPDASKPLPASEVAGQGTTTPAPPSPSDAWQFQISPYLMGMGVKGTVGVGSFTTEVDSSFLDLVKYLNFGFMGAFEARKSRFLVLNDLMYINIANSNDTPGPLFSSVHADVKMFMLGPDIGYRLAESKGASLDVIAGIRYWHMSTDLDFRAGAAQAREVTGSTNFVDGVGGLKGKVHLSSRLFLTGLWDIGGGSSFTYQLFGGGGYQVGKKWALVIGYRYMKIDYETSNFTFDAALKGMMLGATYKF